MLPGDVNCCGGVPAEFVGLGVRVAIHISQVGHHSVKDSVVDRGCGLVIEILNFFGGKAKDSGPRVPENLDRVRTYSVHSPN